MAKQEMSELGFGKEFEPDSSEGRDVKNDHQPSSLSGEKTTIA